MKVHFSNIKLSIDKKLKVNIHSLMNYIYIPFHLTGNHRLNMKFILLDRLFIILIIVTSSEC